tara:strand:+ start:2769 stop:2894 length:126 start_codon:yes stop_codon:yes gene_type:complete
MSSESQPWAELHRCAECHRIFDMWDDIDAEEWHYGHDCEVE